jgi:DNA-binding CsgD family transcriptional regulator
VSILRRQLEGHALSQPEVDVLRAAADGLSAEETAARLVKSKHTVITQRRSLEAKLGARNLAHAIATAFRRQLIADTGPIEENQHADEAGRPGNGAH